MTIFSKTNQKPPRDSPEPDAHDKSLPHVCNRSSQPDRISPNPTAPMRLKPFPSTTAPGCISCRISHAHAGLVSLTPAKAQPKVSCVWPFSRILALTENIQCEHRWSYLICYLSSCAPSTILLQERTTRSRDPLSSCLPNSCPSPRSLATVTDGYTDTGDDNH